MPLFGIRTKEDIMLANQAMADSEADLSKYYTDLIGRGEATPTATGVGTDVNEGESRGMQQNLITALFAQARGEDTPAMRTMREGIARTAAGVSTLANARRGVGAGQSLRSIAANQAGVYGTGASNLAALGADSKQLALAELLNQSGRLHDSSTGLAGGASKLTLEEQGMLDKYLQSLLAGQLNAEGNEIDATEGFKDFNQGQKQASAKATKDAVGAVVEGGTTAIATGTKLFGGK